MNARSSPYPPRTVLMMAKVVQSLRLEVAGALLVARVIRNVVVRGAMKAGTDVAPTNNAQHLRRRHMGVLHRVGEMVGVDEAIGTHPRLE